MKSSVFFSEIDSKSIEISLHKVDTHLVRLHLRSKIKEKDLVAIKLHFGEKGNTAYIKPPFLRRIVDQVKQCNGKPFLTDTNTLYRGMRQEAVSHLMNAYQHEFTYVTIDAPIIIADGLRGNSAVEITINKSFFKNVFIAHDIYMSDVLISVAHFTGHELCGFSGTLKNLGMGCASREGKLSQHSTLSPRVKGKKCKGCGSCLNWCPSEAISISPDRLNGENKKRTALIHPEKCIGCAECILACPHGAIQIQWNERIPIFQKKMVEYAYGAIQKKKGKSLYLNFLTQITPACDCGGHSETPIVNDIGILSSEDPVALDQASVDLVNGQEGNPFSKLPKHWFPGEDKFHALYPEVDWSIQLAYAEEIGLGTREYELIKI